MEEKKLLELYQNKNIVTAYCYKRESENLWCVTEEGKELKINAKKALSSEDCQMKSSDDRFSIIQQLKEISGKREKLSEEIDLHDLWEITVNDQDEYSLQEMAKIYFGDSFTGDEQSSIMRSLNRDKLYFKRNKDCYCPNNQEYIDNLKLQKHLREKREKKHEIAGLNFKAILEGRTNKLNEESMEYIHHLKDVCIKKSDSPKFQEIRDILGNAGIHSNNAPFEILVKSGIWNENENLLLKKYEIEKNFSEVIEKYCQLEYSSEDYANFIEINHYIDNSSIYTITIDDESTKDFDDAISLEIIDDCFRVGIHITDVSFFVLPDSLIDKEALERATSIYMPDLKIEMLPRILSEEKASLIEGKYRPVISYFVILDNEAAIMDYSIQICMIKIGKRMTYKEVDNIINEDQNLNTLYFLADKLLNNRIENGSIYAPFPRINVVLDEHGNIEIKKDDTSKPSNVIVSEMMILANSVAGDFCIKHNIPAIYRGQPAIEQKIEIEKNKSYDLFTLYNLRKYLKKGTVDIIPAKHHGLGVEHYIQATSPLRRYSDLVMQRQIKHYIMFKSFIYSQENLSEIIELTERSLEIADLIEKDRKNYYIMKYLEKQTGVEYEALVLKVFPEKMIIQLSEVMFETDCLKPRSIQINPGDLIIVIIELVWPREGTVRVSFQGKK